MNPAFLVLVALTLISASLSAILAVAWGSFGRPRHALLWLAAFAVAALQWFGNLLGALLLPGSRLYFPVVSALVLLSSYLILAGFRRRAGLGASRAMIAAGIASLGVIVYGCFFNPYPIYKSAPTLLYGAAAMLLGARSFFVDGRVRGRPHHMVVAMLVVFAVYSLAAGTLAAFSSAVLPPDPQAAQPFFRVVMLLGLPAMFVATGVICVFLLAIDMADDMRRLAQSDPLTGILNRRGMQRAVEPMLAAARRHRRPLAIAVADLDHFKMVNDRFGHQAGDLALKRFAECVSIALRQSDQFARLGGEEFVFLLPDTDLDQASEAMERMRRRVAHLHAEGSLPFPITASFGVAQFAPGDADLKQSFDRADAALYQSKLAGRNRVTREGAWMGVPVAVSLAQA